MFRLTSVLQKSGETFLVSDAMSSEIKVCIKGGGDIASGVAWRLWQCGLKVVITEIAEPTAVRRSVSFCEAVYDGKAFVEGLEALLVQEAQGVTSAWDQAKIPVMVDPECQIRHIISPDVIVDSIIAKKNTGTSIDHAPLVIALGPGFEAGKDVHFVVETNRGHNLGRLLTTGCAEPDTGIPGPIGGIAADRVLRAPLDGLWQNRMVIGDLVKKGDTIGLVNDTLVISSVGGVLRGMIRPGLMVKRGLKIGDVDPRGRKEYCSTISEKALSIAGGVLEGILRTYNPFKNLEIRHRKS